MYSTLPTKNSLEVIDYTFNWKDSIDKGDKIVASSFVLANTTVQSAAETFTDTSTTIWLKNGTKKAVDTIQNIIRTDKGRIMEVSVMIHIK